MMMYDNTKVTLELRELVKSGINIWDFDYPSYYQGEEKTAFEQKVIDHYYFRQIGQETVGRWLHYFQSRIREIMPYYIQLYKSQEIMEALEDPFATTDITETYREERENSSSGSSDVTNTGSSERSGGSTLTGSRSSEGSESKTGNESGTESFDKTLLFSDTPQGTIANIETHLTNATKEDNATQSSRNRSEQLTTTGTASDNQTTTNTETLNTSDSSKNISSDSSEGSMNYTLTKKGSQGVTTYAHDMKELRETFLNIDMQIIDDLNCLFLGIY